MLSYATYRIIEQGVYERNELRCALFTPILDLGQILENPGLGPNSAKNICVESGAHRSPNSIATSRFKPIRQRSGIKGETWRDREKRTCLAATTFSGV
jgi:hypothetical protein